MDTKTFIIATLRAIDLLARFCLSQANPTDNLN